MKFFKRKSNSKKRNKSLIEQKNAQFSIYLQDKAINSHDLGIDKNLSHPRNIVVSLTTFDKRINDVYLTIESLFQQSLKADKIVLWVCEKDLEPYGIPETLKKQQERGLEIEICDEDLGPYKKFYYALKKYPESLILTVDDDVLYPADMIDLLYRAYQKEPNVIHCHRAHRMQFDKQGKLLPYQQWGMATRDREASPLIFPTGIGGVLYFPGCFDSDILNKKLFMSLAPNADDVWLKAMSLKKQVYCKRVLDERDWWMRFLVTDGSQTYSLKRSNKRGGNDAKIDAVFEHYSLFERLKY